MREDRHTIARAEYHFRLVCDMRSHDIFEVPQEVCEAK